MHNGLLFCNITVKYINYNVLRVFSLISRRFVYFSRSEAESILGHDNIAVCRWNAACCRQPRGDEVSVPFVVSVSGTRPLSTIVRCQIESTTACAPQRCLCLFSSRVSTAMLTRVISNSVCLSAVTFRYCVETAYRKPIIIFSLAYGSSNIRISRY